MRALRGFFAITQSPQLPILLRIVAMQRSGESATYEENIILG
jgi:hypothetical protein